ncbi:MAG: hypothetical protein Kow0090_06830 [Myxococcota bacterium]
MRAVEEFFPASVLRKAILGAIFTLLPFIACSVDEKEVSITDADSGGNGSAGKIQGDDDNDDNDDDKGGGEEGDDHLDAPDDDSGDSDNDYMEDTGEDADDGAILDEDVIDEDGADDDIADGDAGDEDVADDDVPDGDAGDEIGDVSPPNCISDIQCEVGWYCEGGDCVVGAVACISDTNCQSDEVCRNGACFIFECKGDSDCASPKLCLSYTCVSPFQCAAHTDCPVGYYCDGAYCIPPRNCAGDLDCRQNEICYQGECFYKGICATKDDCPPGYLCISSACHPPECFYDSDCPPGKTCVSGICFSQATGCASDADCQTGEICSMGVCAIPPKGVTCQGGTCLCSNGTDDDGDGLVDAADPHCTGPYDNDESSYATGIPGDNKDSKKQDCFFDGDSGQGNDGPNGENCLPLVPNGCDCYGCCYIDSDRDGDKEWVKLVDGNGVPCSEDVTCDPCAPSDTCVNQCIEGETCFGEAPPPTAECRSNDDCPSAHYCLTGKCIPY